MSLTLLCCALVLACVPTRAEVQSIDTLPAPFGDYEELVYEGEFSKALLRGINIAELRFRAMRPVSGSAQSGTDSAIHITMDAVSKGILSKLFKLSFHQRVESKVEPASFRVLQTNKLDEQGKRQRISEAVFDHNAGKVVWTERDPNDASRQPRVVTNPLSGTVQDIASAFYFLRTFPLKVGQTYELLISDSGQVYRTPVHVTERKKMKTVVGEVWTVRVEAEVFGAGHLLRGQGKMSLWYTDDKRHIPVKAQINNEYGKLDIKLKKAEFAVPAIAALSATSRAS